MIYIKSPTTSAPAFCTIHSGEAGCHVRNDYHETNRDEAHNNLMDKLYVERGRDGQHPSYFSHPSSGIRHSKDAILGGVLAQET